MVITQKNLLESGLLYMYRFHGYGDVHVMVILGVSLYIRRDKGIGTSSMISVYFGFK